MPATRKTETAMRIQSSYNTAHASAKAKSASDATLPLELRETQDIPGPDTNTLLPETVFFSRLLRESIPPSLRRVKMAGATAKAAFRHPGPVKLCRVNPPKNLQILQNLHMRRNSDSRCAKLIQ
jgi:hypothetical protein